MRFGINFADRDHRELLANVEAADDVGFHRLGVTESPSLFRDITVSLALVAEHTKRAEIGPAVTTTMIRHPAVLAGAMASIDEISGGRAFLGIGSGDSAVGNLGLARTRPADMEMQIRVLTGLFTHGRAEYQATTALLTWVKRVVPVYLAAGGPKMLRVAGRVADGVILCSGLDPEVIASDLDHVREGAREAGRDPAEIKVWLIAIAAKEDSEASSIERNKTLLATFANHSLRTGLDSKKVPSPLREALDRLHRGYIYSQHIGQGGQGNATLIDSLGLTGFLAKRFLLCGTPDEIVSQARVLSGLGVQGLHLTSNVEDRPAVVEKFGRFVIPRVP